MTISGLTAKQLGHIEQELMGARARLERVLRLHDVGYSASTLSTEFRVPPYAAGGDPRERGLTVG